MPGLTDLLALRRLSGAMEGFARIHLIRTGLRSGLFEALRSPLSAGELAARVGLATDLVASWLRACSTQGLVQREGEVWRLSGFSGWLLDSPEADALHAMLEQVTEGWHPRFTQLPELMKGAERPVFGSPEEAARVAAASHLVEARALDALRRVPGARSARRVLDVGCGHGSYLVGFLTRYRDAHGLGVELDPSVAEEARRRLREAEVSRRAEVRVGDFLTMDLPAGSSDLIMLNNNIYYFAPADHAVLFRRIVSRLVPGGVVAIQSPCPVEGRFGRYLGLAGGSAIFDLFLRTHRNLYGLPDLEALHAALLDAGFVETGEVAILPGGAQRYIWARTPSS